MESPVIILKAFNHVAFPVSVMAGHEQGEQTSTLPPLAIVFNFQDSIIELGGEWSYLMDHGRDTEQEWYALHRGRIFARLNIQPAGCINLADSYTDGAMLLLDGSIHDGEKITHCTGIMALDKLSDKPGTNVENWHISLYLYEEKADGCEITLKIPLSVQHKPLRGN